MVWGSLFRIATKAVSSLPSSKPRQSQENVLGKIEAIERERLPQFSRILHANQILDFQTIPRCQDIHPTAFEWYEPPVCVLFISHRWASPTHPDTNGEQLRSIKYLLEAMVNLASTYDLPQTQRTKYIKTLRVHGYLQAANILSRVASNGGKVDSKVLETIGIWLDYMCLPQKIISGVDDRTPADRVAFKNGLRDLPSLISSCDFIVSIRRDGDDYIDRAWCISEICFSSWNSMKNAIVLREDLLGQPIDKRLLSTKQKPGIDFLNQLKRIIDTWEQSSRYNWNYLMPMYYADIEVVEEDRLPQHESGTGTVPGAFPRKWPTPFLTFPRVPQIWPSHEDFLLSIRTNLLMAPPRNVDLLITMSMQYYNMCCYNIKDYTRCGLHILLARMSGHSGWRNFFIDCLARVADEKPLILADIPVEHIKDGIDIDSVLTYRWEADECTLSNHARATAIWKSYQQRNPGSCELPIRTQSLFNATFRGLKTLSIMYSQKTEAFPLLRIIDKAMDIADLELPQADDVDQFIYLERIPLGLALLYAHCQGTQKSIQPGAERLSNLFLTALSRLQKDPGLHIVGYKDFTCDWRDV